MEFSSADEPTRVAFGTVFYACIYWRVQPADPGGFASEGTPTCPSEAKQPLTAPPNTPKTTTHLCQRDELLLFKEIFRIVKLGAKFTVTFLSLEGAKVSQPDTVTLLQFADDGFKDDLEDGVSQAP